MAKEKCQLYVLQAEEGTTASLCHLPQRTQLPPEHVELLCHNGTESSSRARIFPNGQASRPGKLPINLPWDQLHPIFQRQRAKKKKKCKEQQQCARPPHAWNEMWRTHGCRSAEAPETWNGCEGMRLKLHRNVQSTRTAQAA